jgi:hypothetical protein
MYFELTFLSKQKQNLLSSQFNQVVYYHIRLGWKGMAGTNTLA